MGENSSEELLRAILEELKKITVIVQGILGEVQTLATLSSIKELEE